MQSLEESGSSSVDLYNGNFSLLLDLAPHMAALNVNVWEMPEISITTIYNDTAQHSLPIVINLLSNAFYRLENCMYMLLLLLLFIIFMQGIYTYIPETDCVSRVYSVTNILCLLFIAYMMLFPMLNLLCFYSSTF
jgi:hypothetical protein